MSTTVDSNYAHGQPDCLYRTEKNSLDYCVRDLSNKQMHHLNCEVYIHATFFCLKD